VFALSRISNYRVTDWLRVFGFEVEVIPRLQLQLSSRRTVLLDSSLDDPNAFIPWLRNLGTSAPPTGVVPLSQVLEWTKPRRLASLGELQDKGSYKLIMLICGSAYVVAWLIFHFGVPQIKAAKIK